MAQGKVTILAIWALRAASSLSRAQIFCSASSLASIVVCSWGSSGDRLGKENCLLGGCSKKGSSSWRGCLDLTSALRLVEHSPSSLATHPISAKDTTASSSGLLGLHSVVGLVSWNWTLGHWIRDKLVPIFLTILRDEPYGFPDQSTLKVLPQYMIFP